jgi:plastocyanin
MKLAIIIICSLLLLGCGESEELKEDIPMANEDAPVTEKDAPIIQTAPTGQVHKVSFTNRGISPNNLQISIGDTIVWKNERSRNKAQLVGAQACAKVRSPLLANGEEFSYTFDKSLRCNLVDSVFVGAYMVLKVE